MQPLHPMTTLRVVANPDGWAVYHEGQRVGFVLRDEEYGYWTVTEAQLAAGRAGVGQMRPHRMRRDALDHLIAAAGFDAVQPRNRGFTKPRRLRAVASDGS